MSVADDVTVESNGSQSSLLPCLPCAITPIGSACIKNEPTLYQNTGNGHISPRIPVSTPVMETPPSSQGRRKQSGSAGKGTPKKCRRSLNLREIGISSILNDSGSDGDYEDEFDEANDNEEDDDVVDFLNLRQHARKLRNHIVQDDEDNEFVCKEISVDANFCWSENFTSFTGQKESYSRVPGPAFSSHDPVEIFSKIWDHEFIEMVVRETNKHAWDLISDLSDPDTGTGIPNYLESWTDVTVEEMYRYFAILIFSSFCHRSRILDYWDTGIMGMRDFREIMSRNRFSLINKFLHFVCNDNLSTKGHDRKIRKVAPVVDHCNRRFAEIYTPSQYLSLDESLLLWKGRLSWRQSIRTKAARYGIKSFELCEAETGYLLQYRLYTGKNVKMYPELLHGFQNHTAKVVLDLIEGYLDVGHVLVMDNWYNQLPLTRYLKTRHTDVLGTLNRRRNGIPPVIKNLMPNEVERGMSVSRHCGDIALVAWKDVKLVTAMSSYHKHEMIPRKRAGQTIQMPAAIREYNQYMGGVDLKDQKLSMYLMERKRNQKWYIKVFRRLFNTSLLNAYVIYTRNPMYRMYSHREFRKKVAEGLLRRYPRVSSVPYRLSIKSQILVPRLQPGKHFPVYTQAASESQKAKHKQLRCVRCAALKRRVCVTIMCKLCKVPLCVGKCWEDYHTMEKLK